MVRAFIFDHLAMLKARNEPARPKLSKDAWLGWLVIIGSLPVGTIGLVLKKQIEGPFTKNLWVIATMMIVVAILLMIAELVGKRDHAMDQLGVGDALAVGFAQVLALIPGSSRSGSTIMGGLFAGQTRETAARFSFLLSIPAIAASGLLELKEAMEKLRRFFPTMRGEWTATEELPGGDVGHFNAFRDAMFARYPNLGRELVDSVVRRHGSLTTKVLRDAKYPEGLGRNFGANLTQFELEYLVAEEWAQTADDVLWRRTKCGLHMTQPQRDAVADFMKNPR